MLFILFNTLSILYGILVTVNNNDLETFVQGFVLLRKANRVKHIHYQSQSMTPEVNKYGGRQNVRTGGDFEGSTE